MTVAPTTHTIALSPAKAQAKTEPVAAELVASLIHPDKKATVYTVQCSPDGQRLFTAGHPSGVMQFWDVDSRKELRRIDIPPAYVRGSMEYALLTRDWKGLYVPVANKSVKAIERDGKQDYQVELWGQIRAWDLAS